MEEMKWGDRLWLVLQMLTPMTQTQHVDVRRSDNLYYVLSQTIYEMQRDSERELEERSDINPTVAPFSHSHQRQ